MSPKTDRAKIEALAEKYIKKGRPQDAIAEYRKLLEGNAQDIALRNILGDLYIKANDTKKAVEEFVKIAEFYEDKGLFSKAIAIYKRIKRVEPNDLHSSQKLANLYRDQGFSSEAKLEYSSLAKRLSSLKRTKEAISMYENLLKLDKNDTESRLTLAGLYTDQKMIEMALDEYNRVAESKIRENQLEEAREVLVRAKELKEDHSRTITNLIQLFKKENKKKEALDLVKDILEKDKDNVKALYILGNLHLENKSLEEAEDVFSRIIQSRPKEVEARVKLGRICIQKDALDEAFAYFEPLVDTLLRKEKYDKAVGLLGLILASKNPHLPTFSKLASIYKKQNQQKNFELVCKVLLEEHRKKKSNEGMLAVYTELVQVIPENEEYKYELMQLKKAMGIIEEGDEDVASVQIDEAKSTVDATLAQAELYVEQGLVRNAKRILENLKNRFPEDPRILQRIEKLSMIPPGVKADDISNRVEKVTRKETQIFGKIADKEKDADSHIFDDDVGEEKVTSADIFAETDIVPIITKGGDEKRYYDLTKIIDMESEAIKAALSYQIRGDTTIVEKALSDIVSEFRKSLEDKVEKDDYESHYNLGIAFLEQGLFDEAINECVVASEDKGLEVECYSVISFCYKQKKNFKEAVKWLEKAQSVSKKDSDQAFALKYELAALFEEMDEIKQAVDVYQEVLTWNPDYRDVSERIAALKGNS